MEKSRKANILHHAHQAEAAEAAAAREQRETSATRNGNCNKPVPVGCFKIKASRF